MPWSLERKIEIAAPPSALRAKFLDFPNHRAWSPDGFIRSVSPIAPSTSLRLESNEPISVELAMGTYKSTVVTNTPEEFAWRASMPYVFTGQHHFKFTPSETPGHTVFTQVEYFSGALGWMMGDGFVAKLLGMRESTAARWEAFNKDLKAEMESK